MELRPGEMAEHGGGDRRSVSSLLVFSTLTLRGPSSYTVDAQAIENIECFSFFYVFQLDTHF